MSGVNVISFYHRAHAHFRQRVEERGVITTDVDGLFRALARGRHFKDDSVCQYVRTEEAAEFWRFFNEAGPFYAVFHDDYAYPVTVMSHAQFRVKRQSFKNKKRTRNGKHIRRPGSMVRK